MVAFGGVKAGGVFNVTGEGDFSQFNAAAHVFNNAGTFNKSGTDTTTTFGGGGSSTFGVRGCQLRAS